MENNLNIQWYPGHMTKTRRMMEENLKLVDAVCEILDARIPISSRNPDIDAICGNKPRMVILNRIDMADPNQTKRWAEYFRSRGMAVIQTDCKSRKGINTFVPAVRQLLKEKLQRYAEKGQVGRPLKLMIVGIRLAYTGAVKDDVIDIEGLSCHLIQMLWNRYPDALRARYKIDMPEDAEGYDLLEAAGRKRGFLISGGEIDTERMAKVLLEEYRSCKLGCFTLEDPRDLAVQEEEA